VPYRGQAPALTDLLGGQVQVAFVAMPGAIEYIGAGKLRALAVTGATRAEALPDIPIMSDFVPSYEASFWIGVGAHLPTMDEAGVKGFNLDAWGGLVAAAGTPPEIIKKLNVELRKIIDSPDVQASFKNIGFEGFSSTPEELGDYIKVQLDRRRSDRRGW
jgi:tripartite-type tricarboxylate transporter receptor subunit TctC